LRKIETIEQLIRDVKNRIDNASNLDELGIIEKLLFGKKGADQAISRLINEIQRSDYDEDRAREAYDDCFSKLEYILTKV
jgi:hypothetical protein